MDTLLEQATPQYEVPTHLLEVVGKALYGWGDDEPNEATGYTAVYESVQVAAAVHAAGYRLNAYEPLVKALRELLVWADTVHDEEDTSRLLDKLENHAPLDAARAVLATVESSPEREMAEANRAMAADLWDSDR